jgi:hypothetical protein
MQDVRDGCCQVVAQLEEEKTLNPQWTQNQAVDLMGSMLMVENWEHLTQVSGWSQLQYVEGMKQALKQLLIRGSL